MYNNDVVFLSLGSNIDDKVEYIENAKKELSKFRFDIVKESSLYKTEPYGNKNQDFFINQVIKCKTSLTPLQLLILIKNTESKLGRISREKWGPREIDIDILFYNNIIMNSDRLIIPHEDMHNRRFVLVPFAEIEKDFVHPLFNKTIQQLLEELSDNSLVEKF